MPRRPITTEIATISGGRDITRGYVDALRYLPPTDPILTTAGGWRGYEELLRDDRVASTFAQRRLAVVSRPWTVEPGGDRRQDRRAAELVRETLERIGWDHVTDQMLYARLFGFSVAELIWATSNGQIYLDAIKVRDRARFAFTPDGSLLLRTLNAPDGEPVPDRKFWVVAVGHSHHDEPYGRGLAHQLWWPVWFKRQGARFWAQFLEKFASPTTLGRFPPNASDAERDALLAACQAVATDAAVVIPEGMQLELVEAARTGADYHSWLAYWDRAITTIILGQTMTTEDGSSRSQAEVHAAVRREIVQADADLICESANRSWVRWLVELAVPGAAPPRIYRELDDPEDLMSRSQRDRLLYEMGWSLTAEAVARIYGDDYRPRDELAQRPAGRDDAPLAPATEPVEAAEPRRDREPVEGLADLAEATVQPHVDRWVRAIAALAEQANSLEELRGLIIAAYGWLPRSELVAALRAAQVAAIAAGWLDAEADARAT